MNTPTPSRAEATFNSALALPPEERPSFVAAACGGDTELLSQVQSLLAAHEDADGFLKTDAAPFPKIEAHVAQLKPEEAGDRIGPYKLLQEIGQGGFGTVWMADQEKPVRRRVALKIIKLGMDTKKVIARFEQERQALAMMDHPNIAKIFDAGTTQLGRPFFVMELVRGVKITDYCDEQGLCTEERIKLFIQICQAVQHAHQKGIIHRDLKPSNILVTINDGEAVSKVIDFGVTKATQGYLTDGTLLTKFEQMIGTPLYMSPEQAEMTSLDVDTRSDIYSLGVLLYELLTGGTPIDTVSMAQAGMDEIRRLIREVDPPRPSQRLKTLDGNELTALAKRRHTEPAKLSGSLRGDLDWILMMCLEKDRKRRYDTANGLALDLKHYLNSEIVTARPPTTRYLLARLVRRHRGAVIAGIAIAATLVIGCIVSALQAIRANREAAKSAAIVRFLTEDLLFQATPEHHDRSAKVTMEQVLERAAQRLEKNSELARQPELEATLRTAMGSTYEKLGQSIEAKRHLTRAVALWCQTLGPQHRETLLAQLRLLEVFSSMNLYTEESERLTRETVAGLKKLTRAAGHGGASKAIGRASLDAQAALAWQLAYRGQLTQAIQAQRALATEFAQTFGADDPDTINEYTNLSRLLSMNGAYGEAVTIARESHRLFESTGRRDDLNSLTADANFGLYLILLGATNEAEPLLADTLRRAETVAGKSHPISLLIKHRLARACDDRGDLAKAPHRHWRCGEASSPATTATLPTPLCSSDV